ncbi:MAG: hypothetical protein ACI88L_000648 [Candidatus Paceibacteria bacterium]|jgi:hypothetical protein
MSKDNHQKEGKLEDSGWLGSYEKNLYENPEDDEQRDNYESEDSDW